MVERSNSFSGLPDDNLHPREAVAFRAKRFATLAPLDAPVAYLRHELEMLDRAVGALARIEPVEVEDDALVTEFEETFGAPVNGMSLALRAKRIGTLAKIGARTFLIAHEMVILASVFSGLNEHPSEGD